MYMYICIFAYICIIVEIYTYIFVYICINVYLYVYTCIYMHVQLSAHICFIYMQIYIYICICLRSYAYTLYIYRYQGEQKIKYRVANESEFIKLCKTYIQFLEIHTYRYINICVLSYICTRTYILLSRVLRLYQFIYFISEHIYQNNMHNYI